MSRVVFFSILCFYLIFFFLLPPFQTPDEQGHYETVYWMSRGIIPWVNEDFTPNPYPYGEQLGRFFNFGNDDSMLIINRNYLREYGIHASKGFETEVYQKLIPSSSQAYNPPFYYLVAGLAVKAGSFVSANLIEQFYLARLTSGLFYFVSLFFFYRLLLQLGVSRITAVLVQFIIGLNPLFLQTGIGIGPDMAFCAMAVLSVFLLVRYLQTNTGVYTLGLSVGLACLTKITGIVFICILVALAIYKRKQNLSKSIVVSVAVQLPLYLFNFVQYGKPVLTGVALGLGDVEGKGVLFTEAVIETVLGIRHTFMHFSGFLGWNDVYPFSFIFWPYTFAFFVLLIVGYRWLRKTFASASLVIDGLCIGSALFFSALALLRVMYFNAGWGIGGRNILYLFPFFTYAVVLGISQLTSRPTERIVKKLVFFSIAYYYLIIITVLIPRYYV